MKNYDLKAKKFQTSDPIESYFECMTSCELEYSRCITSCVEILKQYEN